MKTKLLTSPFQPMPIGKYKGRVIQHIIYHDPSYIEWMRDNSKSVSFSQEIKDALRNWKFISQ